MKTVLCLPVVSAPSMTIDMKLMCFIFYFLGHVTCDVSMLKVVCAMFILINPSDVTDTDGGSRENSKPPPCEDSLALSEAEPETEVMAAESDPEPGPEVDEETEADEEEEADEDAELEADEEEEAEPEAVEEDEADEEAEVESEVAKMAARSSFREAEDDRLSVSTQNEDTLTLEVDGDDLLETGKHVKLPDPEVEKGTDEMETSADTSPDDDTKKDKMECHKDGKRDDVSMKNNDGDDKMNAESEDKEKDSGKKGPSATGASGQAKRFVFLCQFFDTPIKSSSLRTQLCG